jgi:hypothetical protein
MVAPGRRVVTTTIYGEDSMWLKDGEPLGGSEPDPPLRVSLAEMAILESGFAIRDDDLWRLALLADFPRVIQGPSSSARA